ncbi:MAG: hypothetical protein IT522_10530 [Burkholderiales bacterium]|nr:hypothetical protein [Burkholderiales bacterium]
MTLVLDYPLMLLLPTIFVVLVLAAALGVWLAGRRDALADGSRDDFNVIQTATLTLLGLIIGFTFSMALNRYDQRKNLEEEEANAIGTAYLRAELLPAERAAALKAALRQYTHERALLYVTRDAAQIAALDASAGKLQGDMWTIVRDVANEQPTPVHGLVVTSINDVINAQGYTQAAWWNRIPHGAWILMLMLAVCASFLVGLGVRHPDAKLRLIAMFPLIIAGSFFLIADIDAPRSGVIRVAPMNLQTLEASLR